MLVTRTEAVTKFCPFKFASDSQVKLCENLNCMGWKKAPAVITTREEMGYCGLAGEPSAWDRRG
jgi:hypothetical protein